MLAARPARLLRHVLRVLLVVPLTARAQLPFGGSRCVDTLSASALRRVPVFLAPTLPDTAARLATPTVQLIADDAAARLRRALIADTTALPEAPPGVRWQRIDQTAVAVTLRRDGSADVRAADLNTDPASLALLLRAVRATIDSGGPFFWDERVPGEALRFRIDYRHPSVEESGRVQPLRARFASPVFTLAVPWERPLRIVTMPTITYPDSARRKGMIATVVLEFVVDSAGRAVTGSVRDIWPADRPRLVGELADHYRDFVKAGIRALPRARYEPALLGGCPVQQLVSQPLTFELR